MFAAAESGNIGALWVFLIVFILFCILWAFLLYQGHLDYKAEQKKQADEIFKATRSRQSENL